MIEGILWNHTIKKEFEENGLNIDFVQDNQSKSTKGVLRGLHFQYNQPQGKLVRVIKGEVFDVAVDLRKDSPTYSKYESVILSEDNKKTVLYSTRICSWLFSFK